MNFLIGLNGFKGTGKDTVGQIMVENHEFKRIAFADELKRAVAALLDIPAPIIDSWKDDRSIYVAVLSDNYKLLPRVLGKMTFRQFLQRFGTEMGRDVFGEDFWVDLILPNKEYQTALTDNLFHGNRVVTDTRFPNEMLRIRDLAGYNIRIERPGFEPDGHSSEIIPPKGLIDYTIFNDGTIEDLRMKVHGALEYLGDLNG